MKPKHSLIAAVLILCAIACMVATQSDTNTPAVHAREIQAQINQQAFVEGVRYGLLAKQRNQDIMDINALVQIAYSLFVQQQQTLAQQKAAQAAAITNAPSTNAVLTNAVQKAEKE